jgi:hypothetical protein
MTVRTKKMRQNTKTGASVQNWPVPKRLQADDLTPKSSEVSPYLA